MFGQAALGPHFDWLGAALAAAEAADIDSELQSLYNQIPGTDCARQGQCCSLLPPTTPAEVLSLLLRLPSLSASARLARVTGLVTHFLCNAAHRLACPWARSTACSDYAHRFFSCRAYGLWSPETYAKRARGALAAQERVAEAWQGLGVKLPNEVLAPGPEYCRQVRVTAGPAIDDQRLEELEDQVAGLTRGMEGAEPLAGLAGDPGHLMAAIIIGPAECLRLKVAYTQAAVTGDEHQAGRVHKTARIMTKEWVAKGMR